VRKDRAEQDRPHPATRHAPVQDGDARELADPPGQHGIREQPDGERREDERKARVRRGHRLHDHRAPRERAHEHRKQVEADRDRDPVPLDRSERSGDAVPRRPAP
jgi:hypothetical protein